MGKQRTKPNYRRRVLRLPDLDRCKLAVINSLGSPASRRVYEYAIDQFKAKMTAALRRNLQFAVPDLIHDAQASGGSISTTFKLYKDLTVVCESLDSLLPPGSREGKTELTAVGNDLSDLNRLREELSSYIQQTAASMESKDARLASSAGRSPKRVIVDDNIPERPSPKKRGPSNQ